MLLAGLIFSASTVNIAPSLLPPPSAVGAAEDSGQARAVRPTPEHGIMPGQSREGEDFIKCIIF